MNPRLIHRSSRCIGAVLLLALAGCTNTATPQAAADPSLTPTPVATPTTPPTTVPGSIADEQQVANTVRQFASAVTQGDDTVALLVLTPSAQRLVAASDLDTFLGEAELPREFTVRAVRLNGNVAIAECDVRTGGDVRPLQLQLVRLEGVWKIDARLDGR
jgi:hypothetical protein